MSDICRTIWRVPAYLPYLQPELTADAIAEAEKAIGFTLPVEYLDLLRVQNGGYIRLSLPQMSHHKISGIGPHFSSLTDFDWSDCQEYVSFPLTGLVPFDGDGHWHLCLDYRKNSSNPAITYIDVECDDESPIAPSFKEYLTMLRIEVKDEMILHPVEDIETVKQQLSSRLGVNFDTTDTWAHGYPIERASLGRPSNPQWLWLSPNCVPRGFIRVDDERYNELRDVMPGNALRYPEVPANAYLMSVTDDVRNKVLEACKSCQFTIQPLADVVKSV
ncbi:MAG: SMI1/KNR4 family protein [Planctomycetaceae bacterium]|nr:SMI1/KNR4 family protein [Planctomycetaceae bacterium]